MTGEAKYGLFSAVPKSKEEKPPLPVPKHLRLARGIVIGTLLAIPIWSAVAGVIYLLVR